MAVATPTHISMLSLFSIGNELNLLVGPTGGNQTVLGTQTCMYYPFSLPFDYVVSRSWWINGSSNVGSIDIGIYDSSGTRLASSGLTAKTGTMQYVSTPASIISGQQYWLGWTCNNTTANEIFGFAPTQAQKRVAGVIYQTATSPLPASMSGTTGSTSTFPMLYCGITRTSSGY